MRQIFLILSITLSPILSNSKELLYECGLNTENNFNGWTVHPMAVFDNIGFYENEIEFYAENGGDYSIAFSRKIEDMIGYSTIFVDLNFEELNNSTVNYANVYLSTNGKKWDAISKRADLGEVQITNSLMNYMFVKIVVNITFFSEGIVSLNKVKIAGEYESAVEETRDVQPIDEDPLFHIFSYQKVINIETKTAEDYKIYITDMRGQVIYQTDKNGSSRVEADYPNGIYIISIIQNNKIIQSKKVVL